MRGAFREGAVSVEATLVYTPLSARYAIELAQWNTPEVKAFFAMLAKVSRARDRGAGGGYRRLRWSLGVAVIGRSPPHGGSTQIWR